MKLIDIKKVQELQLELMKKFHAFTIKHQIKYYLIAGSALGAVRHNGFIPWDDDIDVGLMREDYEKFLSLKDYFSSDYDVVNYENSKNCDFFLTRIYIKDTFVENKTILKTSLDKRLYFDIFPLDNVPDDLIERNEYEQQIKGYKSKILRTDYRDYGDSFVKKVIKKVVSFALKPFRQSIIKKANKLMVKYKNCKTDCVCSLCSQYSFKKQVMNKNIYGTPTLAKFEDEMFYIPEKIDEYLTTLYGKDYMQVPPVEKRRKGHSIYVIEK